VFDGLSEMRLLSGNALVYRRQLLALKEFFVERQATVVLLDDRSSAFGDVQPESLVGGNVVLERILPQGQLPLTACSGKDFEQERFAPAAAAPLHGDTVLAWMLF